MKQLHFILLALVVAIVRAQEPLLDLQWEPSSGRYNLVVNGQVWLRSAAYGLHFDNK